MYKLTTQPKDLSLTITYIYHPYPNLCYNLMQPKCLLFFYIHTHTDTHTHTHNHNIGLLKEYCLVLVAFEFYYTMGFPGGSVFKESTSNEKTLVQSLGREDPLQEGMATHCSILAWRIRMDRGAWWATVHWVTKSRT